MSASSSGQFCPRCRYPLSEGMTVCPSCGLAFSGAIGVAPPAPTAPLVSESFGVIPLLEDDDAHAASGPIQPPAPAPDIAPTFPVLQASPPAVYGSQPFPGFPTPAPGYAPSQPMQGYAFAPTGPMAPATPPKARRRRRRLLLIGAVILVLLSIIGGSVYAFTRPKPLISVMSDYTIGSIPVGSPSTIFHIEGRQFSSNSAITFLLDGELAPGSQVVPSDTNGSLKSDLTITGDWATGKHTLTARDASSYTTQVGIKVMIVNPGEAGTPGPNGAPPDNTPLFTLTVTIGEQSLPGVQETLTVQGQPDPAGGTVCDLQDDDGQPEQFSGISTQGTYVITIARTCTGTYKSGEISYTELITQYQVVFSTGVTCTIPTPLTNQQLDGSFVTATTASGTYTTPATTLTCSDGSTDEVTAEDSTWTATLNS